jgi:hypothetical protein
MAGAGDGGDGRSDGENAQGRRRAARRRGGGALGLAVWPAAEGAGATRGLAGRAGWRRAWAGGARGLAARVAGGARGLAAGVWICRAGGGSGARWIGEIR